MDRTPEQTVRQRRLDLVGATNFRDLGGYDAGGGRRTRWGRLYRSDALADLTAQDVARLADLGLHTLIDFRLPAERARKPNALPPDAPITSVELPVMPEGMVEMLRALAAGQLDTAALQREVLRHYRAFPVAHSGEYAAMFDHIERAVGRPVLIHCTAGKDRTGYGAAVILLALGASRETVLEDYSLTNRYRRDISHLFAPQTPRELLEVLMGVEPHYLEASFATIDTAYGSADAYLERALGLTSARRERLRAWLTEPDSGQ